MNDSDDVSERAQARIGTVLRGKWHLDRVVGVGGTASVYAATHRNRSRVAIKMLHREFAANRSMVTRFQREGYLGNAVGHPGTVQVLDDDVTEEGAPFLVMELLDGESLGDRLERLGRLTPHEVASIGCQLLDVLAKAHGENIVHRDLKPDNIFLTRIGQLKVLDFGIARLKETAVETSTGTLQGSVLGTPGFMSPEQALGRWNEVDGRTDIWAVGATLFTLLSGRFVHESDSVHEQLVLAATRRAPRVHDVAPDAPAWLTDIVDRALEFDPKDRFPDAHAMLTALRAACADVELPPLSIPEKPPSIARPTPRFSTDGATQAQLGATIGSVQAMAHSTPYPVERTRLRSRILLGCAAAAVLGAIAAATVFKPGGKPVGEPDDTGGGTRTASAGVHSPSPVDPQPPAPRTVPPVVSPTVVPTASATSGPLMPTVVTSAVAGSGHVRTSGKASTSSSASVKQALVKTGTPKANFDNPPPDNPFDTRH